MIHIGGSGKILSAKSVLTYIGHFSKASWWTSNVFPTDYVLNEPDKADPCFNMAHDPAQQQCFPHLVPFLQPDPVNAYEACGWVLFCICLPNKPICVHELASNRKSSLLDLSFCLHSKHMCVSIVSKWLDEFFAESVYLLQNNAVSIQWARDLMSYIWNI